MKLQFQEETSHSKEIHLFIGSGARYWHHGNKETKMISWVSCGIQYSKLKKLQTTVLCSHAETIRTCINSPFNNLSILLVDAFP